MLEALQASSLHGFQQSTVATRTIFREPLHCREKHEHKRYFAAAALKKRNHIPVSSIVSAGKVIEGDLSLLYVSVPPQPAGGAAASSLSSPARENSSSEGPVNAQQPTYD